MGSVLGEVAGFVDASWSPDVQDHQWPLDSHKLEHLQEGPKWVDVKIMVRFWVPIIIRHLIFRVPTKGP